MSFLGILESGSGELSPMVSPSKTIVIYKHVGASRGTMGPYYCWLHDKRKSGRAAVTEHNGNLTYITNIAKESVASGNYMPVKLSAQGMAAAKQDGADLVISSTIYMGPLGRGLLPWPILSNLLGGK